MFSNQQYFRVYTVNDLVGAELGGALKNIYALATGIVDGIGFGVNAKAAVITRALVEMKRLAKVLGAKEETLNGLTGVGDLIVTCTSNLSRNYQAGYMIGKGENLEEALSKMTMVVEGARTCISAYQAARKYNVYTPLIDGVYEIIYNHKSPLEVLKEFMNTNLKDENE
jgi:glycerol-3-phosphate dehydrogenase (NAD(P)+)